MPEDAELPKDPSGKRAKAAVLLAGLLLLLAANYFLRARLERSDVFVKDYFSLCHAGTLDAVYSQPWYQLLLPIREWTGSWTSTSLVLLPPLTKAVGSYSRLYVLLNLAFVVVAFVTSWLALRSAVFTLTLATCAAFTTYNYHVYSCPGSVNQYFIVSYLLVFLLCHYKLFEEKTDLRLWWPLWGLSLLLFALSYEGWLAYVVWLWLCFPLVAAVLRKAGDKARLVRLTLLLAIVTLTAIAYVGVKRACGWGQVPGSESDVVFNYPHKIIAAEDVISNFFTIFYTVLSNYSPPFLVSSNSLWRYGGEELIRLQSGYHASESHLAAMNHLFLWRFYAGVAATLFVAALAWVGTKAYRLRSRNWVILYVLMLMTLTGSPTHLLVKWRPMHALPYLSYHFYFGVMGLSLLIAYLAHLAHENLRNRRLAWSLIVIVWADIVYCALARPPLLSHLAGQLGMGAYPNPWQTLKQMMF